MGFFTMGTTVVGGFVSYVGWSPRYMVADATAHRALHLQRQLSNERALMPSFALPPAADPLVEITEFQLSGD